MVPERNCPSAQVNDLRKLLGAGDPGPGYTIPGIVYKKMKTKSRLTLYVYKTL